MPTLPISSGPTNSDSQQLVITNNLINLSELSIIYNDDDAYYVKVLGAQAQPRQVLSSTEFLQYSDFAWSEKTHTFLMIKSGDGLYTYSSNLSVPRILLKSGNGIEYLQPIWSPDGNNIAFITRKAESATNVDKVNYFTSLTIRKADGTLKDIVGPIPVSPSGLEISDPAWSPDAQFIALTANVQSTNTRSLYVTSTTCLQKIDKPCGFSEFKFDNKQFTRPTDPIRGEIESWSGPSWSPDSKSIAFNCGTQICTAKLDGSSLKHFDTADAGRVRWLPDGRSLIYRGVNQIMLLNIETGNKTVVTSVKGSKDAILVWLSTKQAQLLLVAPTPAPTPTPEDKLRLSELCSQNPSQSHVWLIENPNLQNVQYRLEVHDAVTGVLQEQLKGTVTGMQGTQPGRKTVVTSAKRGTIKVLLYVNTVLQASEDGKSLQCVTPTAVR